MKWPNAIAAPDFEGAVHQNVNQIPTGDPNTPAKLSN
jgi:hypothetical protein